MTSSIALNLITWTPVGPDAAAAGYLVGGPPVSGRVNAIAISFNFDGADTRAMFLGTAHGGVWRSTDFDSIAPAWVPLTDKVGELLGLPPEQQVGLSAIGALVVDPNHPAVLYAGTGDYPFGELGFAENSGGILKSTDGGNTWSLIGQSAFAGQKAINKIIVDPTDISGNTLYASRADGILKSLDAGVTWQPKMNGLDAQVSISDIDFTVGSPAQLVIYAGVSGGPASARGIWQLSPGADDTWHQMTIDLIDHTGKLRTPDDIEKIKFAHHAFSDNPLVYAAIGDLRRSTSSDPKVRGAFLILNVFKFTGPSTPWMPVTNFPDMSTGEGGYAQSIGLAFDGTVYVGAVGVSKSTDGGRTWASIDFDRTGQLTHVDKHSWAFFGSVPYAGNDGGIWRYDPARGEWQSLNTFGLQTFLTRGASASPTDLNVLIAAAQDNGENLRQSSGRWLNVRGSDGGRVRFDPDPSKGDYAALD